MVLVNFVVKTMDGQDHPYSVDQETTIGQLKEMLSPMVNIPANFQRLIYSGQVLNNSAVIKDLNLENKAVHLVGSVPVTTAPSSRTFTNPTYDRATSGDAFLSSLFVPRQNGSDMDLLFAQSTSVSDLMSVLGDVYEDIEVSTSPIPNFQSSANQLRPEIHRRHSAPDSIQNRIQKPLLLIESVYETLRNAFPENSLPTGWAAGFEARNKPHTPMKELFNTLDRLYQVQVKIHPYISYFMTFLQHEKTIRHFSIAEDFQLMADLITKYFHSISHLFHALSEVNIDVSRPIPRPYHDVVVDKYAVHSIEFLNHMDYKVQTGEELLSRSSRFHNFSPNMIAITRQTIEDNHINQHQSAQQLVTKMKQVYNGDLCRIHSILQNFGSTTPRASNFNSVVYSHGLTIPPSPPHIPPVVSDSTICFDIPFVGMSNQRNENINEYNFNCRHPLVISPVNDNHIDIRTIQPCLSALRLSEFNPYSDPVVSGLDPESEILHNKLMKYLKFERSINSTLVRHSELNTLIPDSTVPKTIGEILWTTLVENNLTWMDVEKILSGQADVVLLKMRHHIESVCQKVFEFDSNTSFKFVRDIAVTLGASFGKKRNVNFQASLEKVVFYYLKEMNSMFCNKNLSFSDYVTQFIKNLKELFTAFMYVLGECVENRQEAKNAFYKMIKNYTAKLSPRLRTMLELHDDLSKIWLLESFNSSRFIVLEYTERTFESTLPSTSSQHFEFNRSHTSSSSKRDREGDDTAKKLSHGKATKRNTAPERSESLLKKSTLSTVHIQFVEELCIANEIIIPPDLSLELVRNDALPTLEEEPRVQNPFSDGYLLGLDGDYRRALLYRQPSLLTLFANDVLEYAVSNNEILDEEDESSEEFMDHVETLMEENIDSRLQSDPDYNKALFINIPDYLDEETSSDEESSSEEEE